MNLYAEEKYDCLSTHIEHFDKFIGGGLPLGRITEIYGPPNVGKTKLIFDIVESILSKNKDCIICYIASSSKTLSFLKNRGINKYNNLIVAVTNKEDEILSIVKKFINISNLIIIDSLAETLTNNESKNIDMNILQNIPKILCELNTLCYARQCPIIVTNFIAYKNNDIVSKWNISYKKYCSLRLYMNEKSELKIITHKMKPQLINGGILK